MRIGINLIALPTEKGSGAFRYIQMLLQAMGEYEIRNCEFIIYKQTQISERYIGIPNSLNVKYVSVPNLGMGIKRVIFEQTLFYNIWSLAMYFIAIVPLCHCLQNVKKIFTLHDVYYITTRQKIWFASKGISYIYDKSILLVM